MNRPFCNCFTWICLCRMDGFYGAYVSTRTAFGAHIGINFINIAFGDSFHGALIDTGAASGAVIRNLVSHCCNFFGLCGTKVYTFFLHGEIHQYFLFVLNNHRIPDSGHETQMGSNLFHRKCFGLPGAGCYSRPELIFQADEA